MRGRPARTVGLVNDPHLGAALGTVLGVWAHPDDEAYLSAGLMALARRAGQRVVVVTATTGERGLSAPPLPPPELAAVRRAELAESLAAVDVNEHSFLGYRDGECASVPPATAADRLRKVMEEVQPRTVVTFGPDGMTGHPDHQAVSAWTTAAWRAAGRPGRLLQATLTPEFHATWGEVNRNLGVWMDGAQGPCTPVDQLALTIELDDDLRVRKEAALRAQRSQTAPLIAALGDDAYRRWWSTEWFVEVSAAR
jgi:LmbE family N-acetylglucosaminyl deacetylase